jgi:multidrug resistance efflux pump
MAKLPKIPTPAKVQWRELRINVVPFVVFAVVLIGVAMVWKNRAPTSGIDGISEGRTATVTSHQDGMISVLLVQPFQEVRAGEPLAVIVPKDARASLDFLRSQLELARIRLMPTLSEENAVNFERLRSDLFRTRSDLAVARVNMVRAEQERKRNASLFEQKLVSQEVLEISDAAVQAYAAEIREKSNAVSFIEARLQELPFAQGQTNPARQAHSALVTSLENAYRAVTNEWGSFTLFSPIDGVVQNVYRQAGENITAGEPILTVESAQSDRIVGYLRQPYPVDPVVGMDVQIRTRERRPRNFSSKIYQVGPQVEVITNSLARIPPQLTVDAGLPIAITIPPGLELRPGETVQLIVRRPNRLLP